MGLGESEINVCTQGVQWNFTVFVLFRSRQLGAVQTARTTNLDAFSTAFHRRLDGALHRPTERHTLHQLLRDRFGYQLRIHFRITDFFDLYQNFLVTGNLGENVLDFVDAGGFLGLLGRRGFWRSSYLEHAAIQDDARTARENGDSDTFGKTLNDYLGH